MGACPEMTGGCGEARARRGIHAVELPRVPGLFIATGMASRGLAWAAIAGETIASLVEGEPPPVEADLLDAVDPGRFIVRALRAPV